MDGHVIALNAGSSSIKFALFAQSTRLAGGTAELVGTSRRLTIHDANTTILRQDWPATDQSFHTDALTKILDWERTTFPTTPIVATGHRVVHGGTTYDRPALLTAETMQALEALIPLAPLHQPHNLAGIRAAQAAWPTIPHIACFDTAFHRTHPFVNDVFALPRALYDEGVRRYGFHGLSDVYVSQRLATIAPADARGRLVIAHLGNGASMCAIANGKSVASSMGFTALDGLPMGTRCGQLDPGVVLYLIEQKGMSAKAVTDMLYRDSGLKGLSGLSHDMRILEAAGTQEAEDAIAYFVFRIRRELGGLAASLNGLDTLTFCGGIGENAWRVRERVLENMDWLGITLDPTANRSGPPERRISTPSSRVAVHIIPTDEEAMIAQHTRDVIADK